MLSSVKSSNHLICTLLSLLRTFTKFSPLACPQSPSTNPLLQIFFKKSSVWKFRWDTSTLKTLERWKTWSPKLSRSAVLWNWPIKAKELKQVSSTSSTTKKKWALTQNLSSMYSLIQQILDAYHVKGTVLGTDNTTMNKI